MTENQIQISTNVQIGQHLNGLNAQFEQAACQNVQIYIEATGNSFTSTEKRAMIKMEQLKLIGGLTLAEVLLRGQTIQEIESQGLWSTHPMGFRSMEEAAEAQGIAKSEYSNVRDLCQIIFPYLNETGYNIADLWETIGKSKFRELIPILKRTIQNEPSNSRSVEQIFENEINDIHSTALSAGETLTDEQARATLVHQLVELGQLPIREMRQQMRPERRTHMEAYALPYRNNQALVMVLADDAQMELLNRRFTGYVDVAAITQEEARHAPLFRELAQYIRGNNIDF